MNPTCRKFVSLLNQPVALAGMGLLAFNTWVLQRYTPGWLSGKLGDFAWFLFAPYLLAALLAGLLPRGRHGELSAGWLAFGLSFGLFAGLKGIAGLHDLFQAAAAGLGMGLKLVFDPTDVPAALVGCALGLAFWLRPGSQTQSTTVRSNRKRELAVLSAALLLMLADAAMPNYGLRCLEASGGAMIVSDTFNQFTSTDGGLSWQAVEAGHVNCPLPGSSVQPQLVTGAADLRYTQGVNIERTMDSGQTWQAIYTVIPAAEVDRQYYLMRRAGNAEMLSGPFAGVKDAASGNVVFSMGQEGLLVLPVGGEWRWVAAGPYSYDRANEVDRVFVLLSFHIWVALIAAVLAFCGLFARQSMRNTPRVSLLVWVSLVLAAISWLVLALLPPIAYQGNYGLFVIGLIGAGLLAGMLLVLILVGLIRRRLHAAGRKALVGMLAGVVYLAPVALWAGGWLLDFETSALIGVLAGAGVVAAGAWFSRKGLS